jgi:hypothetical protein
MAYNTSVKEMKLQKKAPETTEICNQLHGAEPFLRSCHFVHLLKNFSAFYGTRRLFTLHKNPPLVPTLSQINPVHAT